MSTCSFWISFGNWNRRIPHPFEGIDVAHKIWFLCDTIGLTNPPVLVNEVEVTAVLH